MIPVKENSQVVIIYPDVWNIYLYIYPLLWPCHFTSYNIGKQHMVQKWLKPPTRQLVAEADPKCLAFWLHIRPQMQRMIQPARRLGPVFRRHTGWSSSPNLNWLVGGNNRDNWWYLISIKYGYLYLFISGLWYTYPLKNMCSSIGMMTLPTEWKM